jgi:hypothetical protein
VNAVGNRLSKTWLGAIVTGVVAGLVVGALAAVTDGLWQGNESYSDQLTIWVPLYVCGFVAFCLVRHGLNLRRELAMRMKPFR